MVMTMCMIMTMNIYISKDNEEKLRNYDGSMSGLINRLLDDFFKKQDGVIVLDSTPPAENPFNKLQTDKRSSKISPDLPSAKDDLPTIPARIKDGNTPVRTDDEWQEAEGLEKRCCKLAKPCQHWQWDTTTQIWQNSLSGRQRSSEI